MKYVPGPDEQVNLKADMKLMVERICVMHLAYFSDLREYIVWNIEHQYSKELASKSSVVKTHHNV